MVLSTIGVIVMKKLSKKSHVSVVPNVRPDTKMNTAMEIFLSIPADENKRQTCLRRFQAELEMQERTANTYYTLCVEKLMKLQEPETEKALESSKVKKFTSVKCERGTNIAAHVAVFLTKAAAEDFNAKIPGFATYPGIVSEGDAVEVAA